jgi:hypothetical protein
MTIEFTLTKRQEELRSAIGSLARNVIRPQSLGWDRAHGIPEEFLLRFTQMAASMGGTAGAWGVQGLGATGEEASESAEKKKKSGGAMVSTVVAAEELAWATRRCSCACPGLASAVRRSAATGTPEQKERFFRHVQGHAPGPLKWGAYALTEPGAGSDVAGIRTSCRKEGRELGPQRAQVLHHERRAGVVERGVRDSRSEPRAARGTPRVRGREGHAGLRGRQDRGQDGPARERDGRAGPRGLPRPGGEPARRRGEVPTRRRAS